MIYSYYQFINFATLNGMVINKKKKLRLHILLLADNSLFSYLNSERMDLCSKQTQTTTLTITTLVVDTSIIIITVTPFLML